MAASPDAQVLIAGAGPVGLTAALELARRGVDLRIVDPLPEPPLYAKAVGVQPRTLEVFEGMGVLDAILATAVEMNGQIVYVNGAEVARVEFAVPPDVPFGFVAVPQYAVERILRDELELRGVRVERGMRLTGFEQDADGVTVTLAGDGGEQIVRAAYLVGADGAHSVVRKTLGLAFDGAAFEEQYMLGDVEVDWDLPRGWAIRAMHQSDGVTDDLLVCIPLPGELGTDSAASGRRRYRMSMLVPDDLGVAAAAPGDDGVAHGFGGERTPELHHIQAVIDRLSPQRATASTLRWSSVFRISHRIVDAYGRGRAFVAGDAAHIHPPTGAQGMNTGIQDAHNLAWKLALAVSGRAAGELLESYDAERRPVGDEVVGRTVRSAREGIGADSADLTYVIRREAQLLIDYAGSPIVTDGAGDPAPGQRAPDASGLSRATETGQVRLFSLLNRRDHALLCYADGDADSDVAAQLEGAAAAAVAATRGAVEVYLIAAPSAAVDDSVLPIIRDADGHFAQQYSTSGTSLFLLRPDGYLGFRSHGVDVAALTGHLRKIFA